MTKPKILSSKIIFQNQYYTLTQDLLQENDSSPYTYTYISNRPGVVIIPYNSKTKTLSLVKQYRHPHRRFYLEFPSGGIESNESPKQAAIRELAEETKLTSNQLQYLGTFHPSVGTRKDLAHVFLALNPSLHPNPPHQDEHQPVISKSFSLYQFQNMIKSGDIIDSWTLSAYTLFSLKYLN